MNRVALILVGALMVAHCGSQDDSGAEFGALRVGDVLGGEASGFAKAERVIPFVFPVDHGPHPEYRSEWWYLTMVLSAVDDLTGEMREFGVHFTLFRQALTSSPTGPSNWQSGQAYLAHLAITDVAAQRHVHAQRFSRAHPANAFVEVRDGLEAQVEDWTMSGEFRGDRLDLRLRGSEGDRFAVELALRQTRPLRLQGEEGWSRKGPDQASYYYSIPRLEVVGTLAVEGREFEVSGGGWLDREWSTSVLGDDLDGWDWFALRLNDGSDVMVFRLRRRDGRRDPFDHGLFVDASGRTVRALGPDDFLLTPVTWWQDDVGVRWPVGWRLDFGETSYLVDALVDDQVMRLGLVYYEGIVGVRDAEGLDAGRGYMELTGYRRDSEGIQAQKAN